MTNHTKLLSLLASIPLASCAPMSNTNAQVAGAGTAAVGGAILGGVIGHQSGNAAEGAAIGGAGGAIYGYQSGASWFGGDGSINQTKRGENKTKQ